MFKTEDNSGENVDKRHSLTARPWSEEELEEKSRVTPADLITALQTRTPSMQALLQAAEETSNAGTERSAS